MKAEPRKGSYRDYFVASGTITTGIPLAASQAEALYPGNDPVGTPERVFDPRYVIEAGWIIAGLDVDRVRSAAISLANRHGVIRTRIVLDDEIPHQITEDTLDPCEYFKIFPAAANEVEAISLARSFLYPIPLGGLSPLRIAVVPIPGEERHCVIVGVNHFYVDLDGLRITVRDLWNFYIGAPPVTSASSAYETLCRNYAALFSNSSVLDRHLNYWTRADRRPSIPSLDNSTLLSRAIVLRSVSLPTGGRDLNEYARRHRVLPAAVALANVLTGFSPWLSHEKDITVLMAVSRSRLDGAVSEEMQCSTVQLPVTVSHDDAMQADPVDRCKAATGAIFQALRHAAIPPTALGEKSAGQRCGLMMNFAPAFPDFGQSLNYFAEMRPVPRPSPYETLNSDERHDAPGTDTAVIVQVVPNDRALSLLVGRKTQHVNVMDSLAEHLKSAFEQGLRDAGAELADGAVVVG